MYILVLVKSAHKKVLPQKNDFPIGKTVLGQNFFWAHFYHDQIYILEISTKGWIFLYPIRHIWRKKSHPLEETMNIFWEFKSQKCKKNANISKNSFL